MSRRGKPDDMSYYPRRGNSYELDLGNSYERTGNTFSDEENQTREHYLETVSLFLRERSFMHWSFCIRNMTIRKEVIRSCHEGFGNKEVFIRCQRC